MATKGVVHLDLEDESRVLTALGNLKNFLAQIPPENADLRVVANSSAAKFFRRERAGEYGDAVAELSKQGVRFLICANSLSKLGIDKAELLEQCEVVPAGIVELIRLQNEGFAYVKP